MFLLPLLSAPASPSKPTAMEASCAIRVASWELPDDTAVWPAAVERDSWSLLGASSAVGVGVVGLLRLSIQASRMQVSPAWPTQWRHNTQALPDENSAGTLELTIERGNARPQRSIFLLQFVNALLHALELTAKRGLGLLQLQCTDKRTTKHQA